MSRSRGVTIVALCTLLATASARPAFAGPTPEQIEEGRGHFNRGVEFYKENDFRAALVEFKRAYDIAPNYKVLYNLGYTSLELQDYASALRYLERYLADGGADVAADRKTKVGQEIEKLQKRVARITIDVNVEGAEILVDDVVVGKTPLSEAVLVSAGRRRIVAQKGSASQTRLVDVAGGDVQKLSFELASAAPPPPPPAHGETPPPITVAPVEPKSNPLPPGVWVGVAVTGALGVATVVTGVLALSAKGAFEDAIARPGVTTTEVDDARSKTRTFALVTDVLGGATIVSAAVTLIVALTRGKSAPDERPVGALRVQVSPFGASLSGSF